MVTINRDSRNHARAALLAVIVAGLIAGTFGGVATARTRESFKITEAKRSFSKSVDPPRDTRPATQLGVWDYAECDGELETYCDVFPVSYKVDDPDATAVIFRIQWANGPDFDARLYNLDELDIEDQPTEVGTFEKRADDPPPEGFTRIVMRADDLRNGDYAVAIRCKSNCVGKVTISGLSEAVEKYQPPTKYTPPPFTPSATPSATASGTAGAEPSIPPPSPVTKPGKDGPQRTTLIQGIPAAQQASPPSTRGTTITNIVLLSLIGLVVGIGGTIVTLKIRRDLRLKA